MADKDEGGRRLFTTEPLFWRAAHRLYTSSVLVWICYVLCYRVTHWPAPGDGWTASWGGLLCAEFWLSFYWVLTQAVRWRPIKRRTFRDRLAQRYEEAKLPSVDVYVCTADPYTEPPALVISTVLSVMAYDYPAEKLSVYLSDDGGSILTFYASWEASHFAKHWLPFCHKYGVEPRSPAAYFAEFGSGSQNSDNAEVKDASLIKELYTEMVDRIEAVVVAGKVPDETRARHKGFKEWHSGMTSKNHHPVVQILINGKDENAVDNAGNTLPTLVYMAREKRPQHHHNFKAGAMNALIRVSSIISNAPVILNVDCDMYSNNSKSIREALCFFLDEQSGHDIGYVQYPQICGNATKNDVYNFSINVVNHVEFAGMDYWGGPLYIGTGCFHRRAVLCGQTYSEDYKQDWNSNIDIKSVKVEELEEKAKILASCTYEQNTEWGKEIGLKYGCLVEDVVTGLAVHCRGWRSVYYNPSRKGFVGLGPTTMEQLLTQHKRWTEGHLSMLLSKDGPLTLGLRHINLGLKMAYLSYNLWPVNCFATLYYAVIPAIGLLKGVPFFPKMTSPWIIPFVCIPVAHYTWSLTESVSSGDTMQGWWNGHRTWLYRGISSYAFATGNVILNFLGIPKMDFKITAKTSEAEESRLYEQDIIQFGPFSPTNVSIATVALLNLFCLIGGLFRSMTAGGSPLAEYVLQVVFCGVMVAINLPVYQALFIRKDGGKLPFSVILVSLFLVIVIILMPVF